jgi:hypothetical protein
MIERMLLALAIVSLLGCGGNNGDGRKPGTDSLPGASTGSDSGSSGRTAGDSTQRGTDDLDLPDEAWIIKFGRDVRLKRSGRDEFEPVIMQTPFRMGDVLLIGSGSKATVHCFDWVCDLGSGEYTTCCGSGCDRTVVVPASDHQTSTVRMMKRELPPDQQHLVDEAERNIFRLGLDPALTDLMLADLYTKWKLKELDPVLARLYRKLSTSDSMPQLGELQSPLLLHVADLYAKAGEENRAGALYRKNVVLATRRNDRLERLKADSALQRYNRHDIRPLQRDSAGKVRTRTSIIGVDTMRSRNRLLRSEGPKILQIDTGLTRRRIAPRTTPLIRP